MKSRRAQFSAEHEDRAAEHTMLAHGQEAAVHLQISLIKAGRNMMSLKSPIARQSWCWKSLDLCSRLRFSLVTLVMMYTS